MSDRKSKVKVCELHNLIFSHTIPKIECDRPSKSFSNGNDLVTN